MRLSSFMAILVATALSGTDFNTPAISSCSKSIPTWAYNNGECEKKTLHYSKNSALSGIEGTTLHYDLKKNTTSDTISMSAQYSNDQFIAKVQGSYIKSKTENAPSIGKTNLSLLYREKVWDSLSLNATENVTIPVKTAYDLPEPMKYTSLLKALYPLSNVYNVFTEGSYSVLDTPASETISYRNPYSYTTGITYAEDADTAINASYVLDQEADPSLRSDKKIKIVHKHKINKKIKTSVSVIKSIENVQQDKASFDLNYAF